MHCLSDSGLPVYRVRSAALLKDGQMVAAKVKMAMKTCTELYREALPVHVCKHHYYSPAPKLIHIRYICVEVFDDR